MEIRDSEGAVVALAVKRNNLFVIDAECGVQAMVASTAPSNELFLWHMRLGHASKQRIIVLRKVSGGVDFKEQLLRESTTPAMSSEMARSYFLFYSVCFCIQIITVKLSAK